MPNWCGTSSCEQAGALGDRPRDVGRHPVHRVVVGVEDVLAAQHRLRLGDTLSRSATSGGGWTRSMLEHLKPAGLALLGALQQERRQPGLPVLG